MDIEAQVRGAFFPALSEPEIQTLVQSALPLSFPPGTVSRGNYANPILITSGLINVLAYDRPNSVFVPGDMVLNPEFAPRDRGVKALSDEELEDYFCHQSQKCITRVEAIAFRKEAIAQLLESAGFSRWLFENVNNIMMQLVCHQTFLYHGTAYEAVRYILKLARAYHVDQLTHSQIAELSGRNRVTVTKILHDIAQQEPDLLETL